jgi:hypothetical protein
MSKKRKTWIIITVTLLSVALVVADWLMRGYVQLSSLVIMAAFLLSLILYLNMPLFREKVANILNIIGEDEKVISNRPMWYFLLVPILILVFSFYVLLGNAQITIPPVLQFNIIIVSSTLGGLVLAAATIPRVRNDAYRELLSVAQKLIVATILFVLATALLFLVELLGGIEANSFEWTTRGLFRAVFFWATVICFFPGIILFSLGVIDLILVLSRMRRSSK